MVNDIHKRGGTILGTSRGGHDTSKIVDSIQDRGINQVNLSAISIHRSYIVVPTLQTTLICGHENYDYLMFSQVYIIGGDGTQKGASVIFEVLQFNMALTLISSANDLIQVLKLVGICENFHRNDHKTE